jgi:predicted transcriptional regulator
MADRVRRLLREGPATAPEIAAECSWSTHTASNILQSLLLLGHVTVVATLQRHDSGRGRRKTNI